MLSLFTALFTNAMQAALDGTKCQDIASNEVGSKAKWIPDLNGFRTNLVRKFYRVGTDFWIQNSTLFRDYFCKTIITFSRVTVVK